MSAFDDIFGSGWMGGLFDHFGNLNQRRPPHQQQRFQTNPQNPYERFGSVKNQWKHTIPQKKPLKLMPGVPLYTWEEVKFCTIPATELYNKDLIVIMVDKVQIMEKYNREDVEKLLPQGLLPLFGKKGIEWRAYFGLWETLVNLGMFPYPVEIY